MRNFFLVLFAIVLIIVAYETFQPQKLNVDAAVISSLATSMIGGSGH